MTIRVDRCVCTGRTFAELRAIALEGGLDFGALRDRTGAGGHCGLCEPYLRRTLQHGTTVFDRLLPSAPSAPDCGRG